MMKAVLTVVGKDAVGILSKVSTKCAEYNVNILDVSQSILQDMFCMIMIKLTYRLVSSVILWPKWVTRYICQSTLCMKICSTQCTEFDFEVKTC